MDRNRSHVAVSLAVLGLLTCVSASAAASDAEAVLQTADFHGGLVLHLGCGDGRLTAALGGRENALVQGLDADPANVAKARATVRESGRYGQVSITKHDGHRLPYVDQLAKLIVITDPQGVPMEEVRRVLAPLGQVCYEKDGRWTCVTKPWPDDIDEWTHFLHGASNNAVAADTVADQPRSVQWLAWPRFARSHEELSSVSTTVTSAGRIFYIVDEAPPASIRIRSRWALVARDAFSGVELWKQPIPLWTDHLRHFRSGPVHLQRRLVSVGNRVYVTLGLGAPVTAIDAATGEIVRTFEGTEFTEEILVADGVLYIVAGTSETQRVGGGLFMREEPPATDFRFIAAIDAETGERIWRRDFDKQEYLLPLSLAVGEGGVYYQSTNGVARLDAATGQETWVTPRPMVAKRMSFAAPTLIVADGVVLCADREPSPDKTATSATSGGPVAWGVHGWDEPGFARKQPSVIRAYDAESGEELWAADCTEQYNSPVDVFVVDGVAWVGTNFKGYDLKSGELLSTLDWKKQPVSMPHHRCYRNKATEDFIITGRSGVEVVSYEDGWLGNNSWVRGACQYGVMPANGMIYAPTNACACNNKVKILGFYAGAPTRERGEAIADADRLVKGSAYLATTANNTSADDWPMYRRDNQRSGATTSEIGAKLAKAWTTSLGGGLSQPIVVGDTVFVASADTHTIHALSAADGTPRWSFTAEGRIDSSPTYYEGHLLFGAADGCVYCLDATIGELAWRFLAAPRDERIVAFDQVESVWPTNGSVLVQNGVAYVAAGRNSYIDGGVTLYRLDPATGELLGKKTIYDIDPETGMQTGEELSKGFDMEGVRVDLMSGDGESIFMKHYRFDAEGNQLPGDVPHLLSVDGFLGEEWFVRSYWIYGTNVKAGWGGWATPVDSSATGRILAFDDDAIYGYGRVSIQGGPVGHRADAYHLCKMPLPSETPPQSKTPPRPAPIWSQPDSLIVRAMAVTPEKLVVAGPPDVGRKVDSLLAYENDDEALATFRGENGVFLRTIAKESGRTLAELPLDAMPVFDGISTAAERVFVSQKNGDVVCLTTE